MAIGSPIQRKAQSDTGQGATTVITPVTTLAAGTVGVLVMCARAAKVAASCLDSVGNPWTVGVTGGDGTRNFSFITGQIATQVTSANTITVTWDIGTSAATEAWLFEVSGLASSGVYDVSATGAGSGTNVTATTGALAQADEVAFALFRSQFGVTAWTKGSSWSDPTTTTLSNTTSCEWRIVASADPVTADGAFGDSAAWNGMVATFKGLAIPATAVPPVVLRRPRMTSW